MSEDQIDTFEALKDSINQSLTHLNSIDHEGNLHYNIISDPFMLRCGCIISEKLAISLAQDTEFECPICHIPTTFGHEIKPLKNLYNVLYPQISSQEENISDKKESLLSLFYSVANKINENPVPKISKESHEQQQHLKNIHNLGQLNLKTSSETSSLNETLPITTSNIRKFSSTSSISVPASTQSSSIIPSLQPQTFSSPSSSPPSHTTSNSQTSSMKNLPSTSTNLPETHEQKEYLFVKCFPTYRQRFQYNTHSKFLKTKSKNFINNSISPSCKFFALIQPKKWEVWEISSDSKKPPILYCCGKTTGEYGLNFENLSKPNPNEILGGQAKEFDELTLKKKLNDWEQFYCSLSDDFLVISGTGGILRIIDLRKNGKPIYLYISNFPIRCLELSSNSKLIAYGITGKDRITGSEQALVVLHKLSFNENEDDSNDDDQNFQDDPITITFPYRDPINQLSFSNDSNYLSVSTALESRFLTIWVKNYTEPKLVMKSLRNIDTSLESEGITDVRLFPDNQHMIITSSSFNAAPIIIDNNISSINGLQTVAQPKLLLKLDELGSSIHKSTISPRNDTIAILDRNGRIYLIFATKMDMESKRIFIVDQVSNAFRRRECASIQFSKDGYKLYCLDRKGILYINDFAAGLPHQSEITRCKPLIWGN
ncbi:hypothetical protein BN7_5535 [Wickerhamomyces ciferrii]|uniref:SPS-sensor component PTR3 n=1 Tax=Wickerhamomyces ciferrii (strain ATCC 14091 / BCRC 22168 / CBS 111 / JCM 3599 / NBRC 0793 / NRRL Y-1031 F-60-10) TaxID=1206466 RepID=K0KXY7_WICCF|nr:uncharacterized protein BN7_5535 [Wickerhamomyces ciferrii]CCH45948.1 hypothetical protein BN7_5535 [Wickerhamomyces ciferrii]